MNAPIAASQTTLSSLLGRGAQLRIPIYQRPFKWGQKGDRECNSKLNGFIDTAASVVLDDLACGKFFGFLVCLPRGKGSAEDYFNVIDGQQRLTTLSLTYLAICAIAQESVVDSASSADKKEAQKFAKDIREKFIYLPGKVGADGAKVEVGALRLRPARDDRRSYLDLVNGHSGNPDSPIINGYRLAHAKLLEVLEEFDEKFTDGRYPRALDKLIALSGALERMHIVMMEIVEEALGVNSIFESINYKGEKLSDYDLIRNKVVEGYEIKAESESNYEQRWQRMEDDFRVAFGSADYESRLEDFVFYYLRIKSAKRSARQDGPVSTSNIYKKFLELVFEPDPADSRNKIISKDAVDEVLAYAYRYLRLVKPAHESAGLGACVSPEVIQRCAWSDQVLDALDSFARLRVDLPMPVILECVAAGYSHEFLEELLRSLSSFFVRFEFSGGTKQRLSAPFVGLLERFCLVKPAEISRPSVWLRDNLLKKKGKVLIPIYPNDLQVTKYLLENDIYPDLEKMFRYTYVEINRREMRAGWEPGQYENIEVVQIIPDAEHITDAWRDYLSANQVKLRDGVHYYRKIGNLILEEVPGQQRLGAYDSLKQILSGSPLIFSSTLHNVYPTWTFRQIEHRSAELTKIILKHFP